MKGPDKKSGGRESVVDVAAKRVREEQDAKDEPQSQSNNTVANKPKSNHDGMLVNGVAVKAKENVHPEPPKIGKTKSGSDGSTQQPHATSHPHPGYPHHHPYHHPYAHPHPGYPHHMPPPGMYPRPMHHPPGLVRSNSHPHGGQQQQAQQHAKPQQQAKAAQQQQSKAGGSSKHVNQIHTVHSTAHTRSASNIGYPQPMNSHTSKISVRPKSSMNDASGRVKGSTTSTSAGAAAAAGAKSAAGKVSHGNLVKKVTVGKGTWTKEEVSLNYYCAYRVFILWSKSHHLFVTQHCSTPFTDSAINTRKTRTI